jgi:hypothetical protein
MNDFPNDFRDRITEGKSTSPISAANLMQNFAWAKLVADPSLIEDTIQMGFPARKLKIPALPGSGTFVLGSVDGSMQWIATEECP